MDEIAEQLKTEIYSLEEYIERGEDSMLATRWTSEILDPLEQLKGELTDSDLSFVLDTLRRAQSKFGVNGQVAERVTDILEQYAPLVSADEREDEEFAEGVALSVDAEAAEEPLESANSLFEDEEGEDVDLQAYEELPEVELEDDIGDIEDSAFQVDGNAALDEGEPLELHGNADDLFEDNDVERQPDQESATDATREKRAVGHEVESKVRSASDRDPAGEEVEEGYDIFSHKISLDEVQAALDLSIPAEDVAQLEHLLRSRISDKVVATLRTNKAAEQQFILIPRITRFVHAGTTYPCTVINLAKTFHGLFGQLQDLARYRGNGFMTSELPELGWALITPEAPRESLQKSYMEQNQYLRYVATSFGIPSHLVRRRTLVEAVYDLVVCQLVLGESLQKQTLDWTATGAAKNDYICLYFAAEGIRVRDMSRTTRHQSLGVCPSW